jgi:hypothetical protein
VSADLLLVSTQRNEHLQAHVDRGATRGPNLRSDVVVEQDARLVGPVLEEHDALGGRRTAGLVDQPMTHDIGITDPSIAGDTAKLGNQTIVILLLRAPPEERLRRRSAPFVDHV